MFIDTHSHIYSDQFFDDSKAMLQRAAQASVSTILMPAIDSATHKKMLEMEAEPFVKCLSMMGLHPCSVKEDFKKELDLIANYLTKRAFVAIGETGLDFYWDTTFKDEQYEAFEQQIKWAVQYKIPIVIHSRNATKECIDVIVKYIDKGLSGVFHCFGGSVDEANEIIKLGFYLGIGGVLTFKKSGLDEVIKKTGIDKIILETDAPYLAPVPYRGKRNEPSYLPIIANKLAETMQLSLQKVAEITSKNAKNLFKL